MRSTEKKLQQKELESQEQVLPTRPLRLVTFSRPRGLGMAVVLCPQGCSGLEGQNARALQHVVSHGVCHPPPAGGSPAPAPLPHSRVSASCAGFILNQLEGGHSSQHPEQTWRHPEAEGTAHVWGSCSEQPGRLSREQPPPPAARPSFSSHWPEQVTCSAENIQSLVRGQRGQTGLDQ